MQIWENDDSTENLDAEAEAENHYKRTQQAEEDLQKYLSRSQL